MRTTLDIDIEVLNAVKEISSRTGSTVGRVLSELARRALTQPQSSRSEVREPRATYGFRPIPARGKVTTDATVNRLRDDEGV